MLISSVSISDCNPNSICRINNVQIYFKSTNSSRNLMKPTKTWLANEFEIMMPEIIAKRILKTYSNLSTAQKSLPRHTCRTLPLLAVALALRGIDFQLVIPCATTLVMRSRPGKWISILFKDCSCKHGGFDHQRLGTLSPSTRKHWQNGDLTNSTFDCQNTKDGDKTNHLTKILWTHSKILKLSATSGTLPKEKRFATSNQQQRLMTCPKRRSLRHIWSCAKCAGCFHPPSEAYRGPHWLQLGSLEKILRLANGASWKANCYGTKNIGYIWWYLNCKKNCIILYTVLISCGHKGSIEDLTSAVRSSSSSFHTQDGSC